MNMEAKVDNFLGFIDSNIDEINEVKREKALKKFNELNEKLNLCEKRANQLDHSYSRTRKCVKEYQEKLQNPENWTLELIKSILGVCQYVEYQLGTKRGI